MTIFNFRLALSMHVLFQAISKFLELAHEDQMVLDYGDIPEQIDLHVFDCVKEAMNCTEHIESGLQKGFMLS